MVTFQSSKLWKLIIFRYVLHPFQNTSVIYNAGHLNCLAWLLFFIFRKWNTGNILAILGFTLFLIFTNDFLANSFLKAWQTEPANLAQIKTQK